MFALPGDRAVVSALSAGRPRSAAMGRSPDRSALADAQSLTWPARVRVSPTHPPNQPASQPASPPGSRRTADHATPPGSSGYIGRGRSPPPSPPRGAGDARLAVRLCRAAPGGEGRGGRFGDRPSPAGASLAAIDPRPKPRPRARPRPAGVGAGKQRAESCRRRRRRCQSPVARLADGERARAGCVDSRPPGRGGAVTCAVAGPECGSDGLTAAARSAGSGAARALAASADACPVTGGSGWAEEMFRTSDTG